MRQRFFFERIKKNARSYKEIKTMIIILDNYLKIEYFLSTILPSLYGAFQYQYDFSE